MCWSKTYWFALISSALHFYCIGNKKVLIHFFWNMDLNLSWVSFLIWLLFDERVDVGRHFVCLSVFLFWNCIHTHMQSYTHTEIEKSHHLFCVPQPNVNIIWKKFQQRFDLLQIQIFALRWGNKIERFTEVKKRLSLGQFRDYSTWNVSKKLSILKDEWEECHA